MAAAPARRGLARTAAGLSLAAAAALALSGCGAQDGLAAAGTPLPTSPAASPSGGDSPGAAATGSPDASLTPDAELVAAAALDPCPASGSPAPAGGGLPDVVLPCLGEGPEVRLSGLGGVPTVLNVWASWCEPCRTEVPALAEASDRFGGKVRVLGLDQEDDPSAALALLAAAGAHYPSLSDPDGRARAGLRSVALPVTLLVRADGTVAHRIDGPLPDAAALEALVAEHLGVRA